MRTRLQEWAIILGLASLSACSLLGGGCDAATMQMLRLQLPPSAGDLTERCSPGVAPGNAQYTATFTLSPDDVAALQQSTSITEWGSNMSDSSTFEEEAAPMESLIFGSYGDGATIEEVLIDTTNPELYTVHYFKAFVD
jgi:hypothetical protein